MTSGGLLASKTKISLFWIGIIPLFTAFSAFASERPALKSMRGLLPSWSQFSKLSVEKRKSYVRNIQNAVLDLELEEKKQGMEYATEELGSHFGFFSEALAADRQYCVIGGIERPKAPKGDIFVCPTFGRACNQGGDTFLCGIVYGNVCVARTPIETLSARCHSNGTVAPTKDNYLRIKAEIERISQKTCSGTQKSGSPCALFQSKVAELNKTYGLTAEPTPPAGTPTVPPPAAAPPGGVVTPGPPNPPQAGQPPSPGAQPICKGLFGIAMEGTSKDSELEYSFHHEIGKWADAFAQNATAVQIVAPITKEQYEKNQSIVSGLDLDKIKDLANRIEHSTNLCKEVGQEFGHFVLSSTDYNKKFTLPNDAFVKYRDTNIENINDGAVPGGDAYFKKNVSVSQGWDPTKGKITESDLPVIEQIKMMKQTCGEHADIAIMLTIDDHGANENGNCFMRGPNGSKVTPEIAYEKIIKPLKDVASHIVFNINACYSGCFVDKIKELERNEGQSGKTKLCLSSQTRKSTVGYGSDPLMGNTYDSTYPYFLKRLNNPLKALLCSSALDPLNAPQITSGAKGLSQGADTGGATDRLNSSKVKDRLDLLATKLKDPSISKLQEGCKLGDDFPKAPFQISQENATKLNNCEESKNVLSHIPGMDEFFKASGDPSYWPGLEALDKIINQTDSGSLTEACSFDLTKYKPHSTETTPSTDVETNDYGGD